jgi:hypothetical protein
MKKMTPIKCIVAALVLGCFATKVNAQATASASATATIITPIGLTNLDNQSLSFGNIAVTTGADVTLTAAASTSRTKSGNGVTFSTANPGTLSAAKFQVTGTTGYTYDVTLPGDNDVTIDDGVGGGTAMAVTTFTRSTVAAISATAASNVFYVGATLAVGSAQTAGNYSGTFNVIVNYN